jgi:hypothetical protein
MSSLREDPRVTVLKEEIAARHVELERTRKQIESLMARVEADPRSCLAACVLNHAEMSAVASVVDTCPHDETLCSLVCNSCTQTFHYYDPDERHGYHAGYKENHALFFKTHKIEIDVPYDLDENEELDMSDVEEGEAKLEVLGQDFKPNGLFITTRAEYESILDSVPDKRLLGFRLGACCCDPVIHAYKMLHL